MKVVNVQTKIGLAALLFILSMPLTGFAQTAPVANPQDATIQADIQKALENKRFKDVTASVQDGVVILRGAVNLYSDKEDADKKVHHRKNVHAVQNLIEVA